MELIRKHVSQMNRYEKGTLINRISKLDRYECDMPDYVMNRIEERFLPNFIYLTKKEVRKILRNYSIVEYSVKHFDDLKDERVTLLANTIYTGKNDIKFKVYIVYSLTKNCLVTAFVNLASDNHESLDMSIYTKDLRIT